MYNDYYEMIEPNYYSYSSAYAEHYFHPYYSNNYNSRYYDPYADVNYNDDYDKELYDDYNDFEDYIDDDYIDDTDNIDDFDEDSDIFHKKRNKYKTYYNNSSVSPIDASINESANRTTDRLIDRTASSHYYGAASEQNYDLTYDSVKKHSRRSSHSRKSSHRSSNKLSNGIDNENTQISSNEPTSGPSPVYEPAGSSYGSRKDSAYSSTSVPSNEPPVYKLNNTISPDSTNYSASFPTNASNHGSNMVGPSGANYGPIYGPLRNSTNVSPIASGYGQPNSSAYGPVNPNTVNPYNIYPEQTGNNSIQNPFPFQQNTFGSSDNK